MSRWGRELQKQTRKAGEDFEFAFRGDAVALKNADGRFGSMPVDDVISRRLTLKVRRSEDIETFADPPQLIDAGWAID